MLVFAPLNSIHMIIYEKNNGITPLYRTNYSCMDIFSAIAYLFRDRLLLSSLGRFHPHCHWQKCQGIYENWTHNSSLLNKMACMMGHHNNKNNYRVTQVAQDCTNSIANALELLLSCTKPSIWSSTFLLQSIIIIIPQIYMIITIVLLLYATHI